MLHLVKNLNHDYRFIMIDNFFVA